MDWNVEYTNEFESWWKTLEEPQQEDIVAVVALLEEKGPQLAFPFSSGIEKSKHSHMRELRIQSQSNPLRVLYAFDPRRSAILLIGGNKKGNKRWYEIYIPIADKLYEEHLKELKKEKLL
ncbi:MAG: addiction module toxin RelE [Alphaproteobacteria bacterium]|nr:addiction module toxin RelE [Alphaproteobacteria bacterium]